MIDEKLNWEDHINYIAKKISYANYSLNKARNRLTINTKKLLYSGLIHSHLVYGAPIWGFATQNRLDKLLKQQKKAIRRIYNLQYRDHTNNYNIESRILKLPDLIKHTTMCYMQSGLHEDSPWHIYELWKIKPTRRDDLRYTGLKLYIEHTTKDWIARLAPIAQARMWNENTLDTKITTAAFKQISKVHYLNQYADTI